MEVVVLNVGKPYDFVTDEGRRLQGFKVHYMPIRAKVTDPDFLGNLVLSKSLDNKMYGVFLPDRVPAVYDFGFSSGYSSKGKLVEVLSGVKYIRPLKVEDFK